MTDLERLTCHEAYIASFNEAAGDSYRASIEALPATPRTPWAGPSAAERAIADLDRAVSQLHTLRASLAAIVLPIAAANDRLGCTDDMLAIVQRQINRASDIIEAEIERTDAVNDNRAGSTPSRDATTHEAV